MSRSAIAVSPIRATGVQTAPAVPDTVEATAQDVALPEVKNAGEMAPADARELSKLFFRSLRTLEEGTREYQYARNTLIEMNLSLVQFAARRFRSRAVGGGLDMDDIIQVGTIGLIKAIDRYDPEREVEFSTLALPYITGEIKRYFRDTTWAVHVPRRLQELRIELAKAQEALTDVLGRAPTVKEVAEHLELTEEQVIDGLVAANGYTSGSWTPPTATSRRRRAGRRGRRRTGSVRSTRPWNSSRTSTPSRPCWKSWTNATG